MTSVYNSWNVEPAELVKFIISSGGNVQSEDNQILCEACNNNDVDIVKLVLSTGVKPSALVMPMRKACTVDNVDLIHTLIDAGASVKDHKLLAVASYHANVEVVKMLLDEGADVHVNENEALMRACEAIFKDELDAQSRRTEVVRILLEAGADVHARGDLALEKACTYDHYDIIKMLIQAGADVNASNTTCLRAAASSGSDDIVKLLVAAGADVHAANDDAINQASSRGHVSTVITLLEAGASKKAIKLHPGTWKKVTHQSQPSDLWNRPVKDIRKAYTAAMVAKEMTDV